MRKINVITSFCLSIAISTVASALDIEVFPNTEYSFNLKEPSTLPIAPNSLEGNRETLYDFINFETHEPRERWIAYIDTENRDLKKALLIIRVRQDLEKPEKSKITIKLRALSAEGLGEIKGYRKAEIDIVNGEKAYSATWDIKYKIDNLDVRHVDIEYVLKKIESKIPDVWKMLKPILKGKINKLQQSVVMRSLTWKGPVTEIPGEIEADYQIWSPYYRKPKIFFSTISFKGKTPDENLDVVSERIAKALLKNGTAIPPEDSHSKTAMTFSISPNFKE